MSPWIPDEEYAGLIERVAALEGQKLTLADLPYDELILKLSSESSFKGRELLLKRSVGNELLSNDAVDPRALATDSVESDAIAANAVGMAERAQIPAARVHRTTVQSIATATWTALSFDTEDYDTAALHDATNPTRLTVPANSDGIYVVTGLAQFAASGAGTFRGMRLMLNNTTEYGVAINGANSDTLAVAAVLDLNAGDYVELHVYQNTGGALNINTAAPSNPSFAMAWLSK